MKSYLPFIQIVISVLLIAAVLLQQRGTALGSAFGGASEVYSTRRGFQKKLLWSTTALGVIFIGLAILNLLL